MFLLHYGLPSIHAQMPIAATEQWRNLRDTIIIQPKDTIQLPQDVTIDIATIKIIYPNNIQFTWLSNNKIYIDSASNIDTLRIQYRIHNNILWQSYRHKSLSLIDSNIAAPMQVYKINDTTQRGYVHFNSLDYYGTYGRSLMVGNNQDVTMNSNFNLQLNGYILDSIRIEAAITDNSMPFQPDGTSYQLQEFDKIYITFEKGLHKLTAGDFNMYTPTNSYFLQYNKRVQGLGIQSTQKIKNNIHNTIQASGSVAKGQFARNIFNGIEGNQGPYKLRGNNGEQYFIVLAGTERIFIDGQLLQRGQDRDYIINYNTAEITFMPRQMITKDKRIQVEFEYQDRNYLNSLFQINNSTQFGEKLNVRMNAYTNQDAKNQSYMQDLDDVQKSILRNAGDDIHRAFYKQVIADTFDLSKILYRMEQRTINGQLYDSVFVYSTNQDSILYNLNFSNVGVNNGNYIISSATTNGRSYVWVPPVNGVPQGEYEPVILLISPKKHQVFSLGATYEFEKNKILNFELATSNYDPNLFAPNTNTNHWGNAGKITYSDERNVSKKDSLGIAKWTLKNDVAIEYVSSQFKAIAPFRNIEFARDYNVDTSIKANELLWSFQTKLQYKLLNSLTYQFSYFDRTANYLANRHLINLQIVHNNFKTVIGTSLTQSKGLFSNANYWRPNILVEKKFNKLEAITIGAQYNSERNEIFDNVLQHLSRQSFKFDAYSFYIRNDESQKTRVQLQYIIRSDDSIRLENFSKNNYSKEINGQIGLYQLENHVIKFSGGYRYLNILDSTQKNYGSTSTIIGRMEYNGNVKNGFIIPALMYELGTGQDQKRAYTFMEVDAGLGMYMWVDYNQDGVQQINEFELALYNDQKRFIKVLTPTNEYVNVQYMNLNGSVQINPSSVLINPTNFISKTLTKLNNQLSVQINTRALKNEGVQVYNPFAVHALKNEDVLSNVISINNIVFFNRTSPKFGIDYNTIYNLGKNLLTYGIEENTMQKHILKLRYTLIKNYTFNVHAFSGNRTFNTGLNDNRSYQMVFVGIEPSLTWLLQSRFRATASYKFEERQNALNFGGELATMQWISTDVKWSMKQNSTLNAKASYAFIRYDGEKNTSKTFVMLDALQNGINWLWSINWDVRLTKGIELSLNYEGRQPGKEKTIHAGRMSIRALL